VVGGVAPNFDLTVGQVIKRSRKGEPRAADTVHGRFGGELQKGITKPKAANFILVFSGRKGDVHGYHDHWEDGRYHYYGEGPEGDQTLIGVNEKVRDHRKLDLDIHLFGGTGGDVTYWGRFKVDEEAAYYWSKAPDSSGNLRRVVVFRLVPEGEFFHKGEVLRATDALPLSLQGAYRPASATALSPTPHQTDGQTVHRGHLAHCELQDQLAKFIEDNGLTPHSPEGGDPPFDVMWRMQSGTPRIVEIKSMTSENERHQLRLALGQVLDYVHRVEEHGTKASGAIVIEKPPSNARWERLCAKHGVVLAWPGELHRLLQ